MPEVTRVRESRYTNRDADDYSSDDDRSSSYGRSRPAGYRTVQRYRVAGSRADLDDDIRSVRSERYSTPPRAERVDVDRRVERYVDREPERSSHDIIIEREREREPERTRTVVYERERERPRDPISSRPWERERDRPWERDTDFKVERRIERREEQPMQLERYQRETEYYDRPEPAPQPIIIRQRAPEPQQIIVQEAPQPQPIVLAREEPSYEVIHRSEVQEVARPEPRRDDEEYYYRREVRDTDGKDDYAMARYDRRPHDSVSDYSDDEQVIVRREKKSFRSRSPRHRLHLAEGALAGAGAAALLANHREKQGIEVEHKGRNVVGGAILGAIGTEIATRARSRYRESRSRGRRSRSTSRDSHSKLKIGLGLAALGVAAAVANKANQNRIANRDELGRGRSRTRSVSRRRSTSALSRSGSVSKHHDPKHRAATIAKAGAASAAIAGVVEYARNKSRERQGKRSRSHSRLRTGVPIVATGLAGAAVAGLYEMRKAKQEDEEELAETRHRLRRSSRSRSRPRSAGYAEPIDPELGMVQYGADPVYTNQTTTTTESYDPVMSGGGGHRSRSHSRRRDYSSDSDRVVGRSRSRSRARDLAGGAIATGAAAIGINKLRKHQNRKREERENRRRYSDESPSDDYYDDHYSEGYPDSPPRASGGAYYPQNPGTYTTQHTTTSTTHVNDVPQYDSRDYVTPPTDSYGRTAAQRGRDGDNVSLITTESPEEDNLTTQIDSTTSLDRPHNRSVTFAPLSPTSSRRLARIKTNGQSVSSPEEDRPRHHRRTNSDPSSNRTAHRHRRRHSSSPSSSDEEVEELPDRFDESGHHIEHSGKEEMVERIFNDMEAVVDGRVSWRDVLRPLFERR